MHIIIAGGGHIGERLARLLLAENHDVVIVENAESRSKELATELDALVILGDCASMDVLKDAGIDKADALMATTHDDKTNLITCRIAKSYNVPHVVSRVAEPDNDRLFLDLGIDATIDTTHLLVGAMRNALSGDSKIVAGIGNDMGRIMQFYVNEKSKMLGKRLDALHSDLHEPICITRGGQLIFAGGNVQLLEGDILFMLVREEAVKTVTKMMA